MKRPKVQEHPDKLFLCKIKFSHFQRAVVFSGAFFIRMCVCIRWHCLICCHALCRRLPKSGVIRGGDSVAWIEIVNRTTAVGVAVRLLENLYIHSPYSLCIFSGFSLLEIKYSKNISARVRCMKQRVLNYTYYIPRKIHRTQPSKFSILYMENCY